MECVSRGSEVECSMCGDVGFADQLRHCTACRVRVQHTYCCTSAEGVESGSWVCDWCRLEKQRAVKKEKRVTLDIKETTREFSQCTLKSPDSGLEFLIKAALSSEQVQPPLGSAAAEPGNPSPTADCGSNCSSSLESEKLSCGLGSLSCGPGDASSNSCENRMAIDTSISDEECSHGTLQQMRSNGAACNIKRSPNSLRCSVRGSSKGVKQKPLGVKTLKTQLSLPTKPSVPPPLKRLSSLKVLSRSSSTIVGDEQPKALVRRYKSLSDISY